MFNHSGHKLKPQQTVRGGSRQVHHGASGETFHMVAALTAVNVKVERISGVEGTVYDERRKFIYLVPSVMAPEVTVAHGVELRDIRVSIQELERLVSHLNVQLESSPLVYSSLKRVTAAVSAGRNGSR